MSMQLFSYCTCAVWLGALIIDHFCGSSSGQNTLATGLGIILLLLYCIGFDLQVIKYSNSSFVLYWIEPTAFEDVNLYQVL